VLGPGDGVGDAENDGCGDAGEYWITSHSPLPLSVYVLPEAVPVDSMLVNIPAVTTGAVHDVLPTPVGVGEGEGDGAPGLDDGVGDAVPGVDTRFRTLPVPPEPLHCVSATLNAPIIAKPMIGVLTRARRGPEGRISVVGIGHPSVTDRFYLACRVSPIRQYQAQIGVGNLRNGGGFDDVRAPDSRGCPHDRIPCRLRWKCRLERRTADFGGCACSESAGIRINFGESRYEARPLQHRSGEDFRGGYLLGRICRRADGRGAFGDL
jgi:hypothetical protein